MRSPCAPSHHLPLHRPVSSVGRSPDGLSGRPGDRSGAAVCLVASTAASCRLRSFRDTRSRPAEPSSVRHHPLRLGGRRCRTVPLALPLSLLLALLPPLLRLNDTFFMFLLLLLYLLSSFVFPSPILSPFPSAIRIIDVCLLFFLRAVFILLYCLYCIVAFDYTYFLLFE